MSREPDALWEQALQEQEEEDLQAERLAKKVTVLAMLWAENDPSRLKEAERILASTPYLKGGKRCPHRGSRCG